MSDQNYQPGDYKAIALSEKIDFLHRVHTEEVSLWDEDGNDNDIWKDYHIVQDELLNHPEVFGFEDILHIMKIFDDDCFELSWQLNLARMVSCSISYKGKSGIDFYLRNLQAVPANGRFHGWHFPVQWLIAEETFSDLKEALQEQTPEIKKIILQILDGIDEYEDEKKELKEMAG